MLAARAGAPRVLAVEMATEMARVAQQTIFAQGLSHTVKVLNCHSSSVTVSETTDPWGKRGDMLVCEILGTDPLCEGLLPAVRDARKRLLHPDATVIPCGLEVHVALVHSDELMRVNSANEHVCDLNMSALNVMSHRTRAVRLSDVPHKMLSRPTTVVRLNLAAVEPPEEEGESEVELYMEHDGIAHAVVAWFTAHLDGDISVSTAPGVAEPMRGYSWGQAAHYLPSGGVRVAKGETLRLRCKWTSKGLSFRVVQRSEDERIMIKTSSGEAAREILMHSDTNIAEMIKVKKERERQRAWEAGKAAREAAAKAEEERKAIEAKRMRKKQLNELHSYAAQMSYVEGAAQSHAARPPSPPSPEPSSWPSRQAQSSSSPRPEGRSSRSSRDMSRAGSKTPSRPTSARTGQASPRSRPTSGRAGRNDSPS